MTANKRKAVPVRVENLSKGFGEQLVLDQVSLDVEAGEIFVIMGPSGQGKSVLLRTIMGLMSPDSGRVLIDGRDAADPRTHEAIVTSIVFQAGALFNSMTVFDNLALHGREHRLYDKASLREKVMNTLSMLSLEEAAKKFPSELSGGMKKRVAIARALMTEPQLLLYDEPTSELDPVSAAMIAEIIANLGKQYGVTSLVVSHDRDLAMHVGHRVAMMFEGKLIAIAPPAVLREHKDERVQAFLNPEIDIENPRYLQQV